MSQSAFDIEDRWPELFAPLTAEERESVVEGLASIWHEGWVPNREDVADLCAYTHGSITMTEYDASSEAITARMRAAKAAR